MRYTNNLNLALYDSNDIFNITGNNDSLNNNMEIIDNNMKIIDNNMKMIDKSVNVIHDKFSKTVRGNSLHTISYDAVDYPLIELNLYGKSTQNGTPTPDNPVDIVSIGDSGAVGITACGKNLCFAGYTEQTVNGITFAVNDNGSITANGTLTANDAQTYPPGFILPKGTYTLSGVPSGSSANTYYMYLYSYTENKSLGTAYHNSNMTFTLNKLSNVTVVIKVVTSVDNITFYPQIEKGATATDYEPYKGRVAKITSSLPLRGIPVDSGGNYTDSSGQQWICDELVYNADGTGKIIKRTNKKVLSTDDTFHFTNSRSPRIYFAISDILKISNSDLKANMLCNNHKIVTANDQYHNANVVGISQQGVNSTTVYISNASTNSVDAFKTWLANNPTYIIYQLATPQEIELTSAEISALKQLQTFDGITNILNNGGADMDIRYYSNKTLEDLQKQIDDLQAAILSIGSNV